MNVEMINNFIFAIIIVVKRCVGIEMLIIQKGVKIQSILSNETS